MTIKSDEYGFIIGERRLKELAQDIQETKDNTKDILTVLIKGVRNAIEAEGEKLRDTIANSAKEASSVNPLLRGSLDSYIQPSTNQHSRDASVSNTSDKQHKTATNADSGSNLNSAAVRAAKARERDAKGRFIGDNNGETTSKRLLSQVKDFIGDLNAGNDPSGFDPTIDALLELKNTIEPVGTVFGKMSGRAMSVFAGRIKKRRNEEVLPEEQVKANRREEINDKERNRLLRRMLDALLRNNKGSGPSIGLGGLGRNNKRGRFSKLGKFAKGIPFVGGALAAALALGDWDQQTFSEKGGTVGSLAGGAVGAGVGSLLGPVGTVVGAAVGSWVGEKLGSTVAPIIQPQFEKWTDSLIKADLPKTLQSSWDLLTGMIGKALGITPGGLLTSAASTIGGWGRNIWDSMTGERKGKFLLQQQYGGYGLNTATIPYNGNGSGVGKNIKEKQLAIFNAFKKAGFNDNWAAAYTASVGRENDYDDKYLYGKHLDKAGGVNMGMISWQGDRQKRLYEFMSKRGLIDGSGNIIKGQASLDAQAAFKKWEIDNDPSFKGIKDYMQKNPNASKADAAKALGTKDIKWAYGQNVLRNGKSFNWQDHLEKEYNYRDSVDKAIEQQGGTQKNTTIPYANKKPTDVNAVKIKGAEKRPTIKVPPITPELTKIGSNTKAMVVNQTQSDSLISQDVSNRGLAHTFAGGLGYRSITG